MSTTSEATDAPGRTSRILRVIAASLVLAAFGVAFVAFGGRSLAWVVIGTAVAAAVAALLLLAAAPRAAPRLAVALPALAIVALSGIGIVRLPARVVEALSPRRHAVAKAAHDASPLDRWLAAARGSAVAVADVLGEDASLAPPRTEEATPAPASMPRLTLAFDPPAARAALAVLACFLALLLALSVQPHRTGLAVLVGACLLAAPMAAYAIAWARVGNGRIYGVFEAPPNVLLRPYGPFWNSNHFAALLAMTGLLAMATTLSPGLSRMRRALAALVALPLLLGVVDAGSRGGLIGLGAGVVLLGLLLVVSRKRWLGLGLLGAAVVGLVVVFAVVPQRIIGETLSETVTVGENGSNFERSRIYLAESAMARSAPLVGMGLGSFRTAYPVFQDEPTKMVPLHGESDWLETLAEGGAPLFLAWLALVVGLVAPALRVVRRGDAPVLLLGLLAALVGVLVHAAVDFHLREPAVALLALTIAATTHAWARSLEPAREAPARPGASSSRWPRLATAALALAGGIAGVALLRIVPWDRAMRAAELSFAKGDVAAAREAATAATRAAPERAASWALLAACEEHLARVAEPKEREGRRLASLDAAVEALRRDPAALGAARIAGQALLAAGALPEALQAARLAVLVAPGQAAAHRVLGQALLVDRNNTEALPHLAFAFEATPFAQLSVQAPLLTRLVRDAGDRDAARIFGVMKMRQARIYYVHELQRSRHEDEIGPYLRVVVEEGVPAGEADDWTYGLVGNSPEAADLARALLKDAHSPVALTRIGRTLAQAGDPEGRALLDRVIARDDAPLLAFEVLVTLLRQQGRPEEARAIALLGLERHPGNKGLETLVRVLAPK